MGAKRTAMLLEPGRGMLDPMRARVEVPGWHVRVGSSVQDVADALIEDGLDVLIIGPGVELDVRVQCVKLIFTLSRNTAVHLSDLSGGSEGTMAFVQRVLGEPVAA